MKAAPTPSFNQSGLRPETRTIFLVGPKVHLPRDAIWESLNRSTLLSRLGGGSGSRSGIHHGQSREIFAAGKLFLLAEDGRACFAFGVRIVGQLF
jgi:hypothetical protein